MASSQKTPLLGLNQWLLSDAVQMEDFNRDNRIVEAALSAWSACRPALLHAPCRAETGFAPAAVLAIPAGGGMPVLATRQRGAALLTLDETGFSLTQSGEYLALAFPERRLTGHETHNNMYPHP